MPTKDQPLNHPPVELFWSVGDVVAWHHPSREQNNAAVLGSAKTGQALHQKWQAKAYDNHQDYLDEQSVVFSYNAASLKLHIRGRADGLYTQQRIVEELKSCEQWPPQDLAAHWRQVQIYGALLATQYRWPSVKLRLQYLHRHSAKTQSFEREYDSDGLFDKFIATLEAISHAVELWQVHLRQRQQYFSQAALPFAAFRPGQRDIAEANFKTLSTGSRLLISAQTGHGKTYAALIPTIKWLASNNKAALYLTHRNNVKAVVEKAISAWTSIHDALWSLSLHSRAHSCVIDELGGCTCPEIDDALWCDLRITALLAANWQNNYLADLAKKHQACLYQLSRLMAPFSDLSICDVSALRNQSPATDNLRWGVMSHPGGRAWLLDEIHQLPARMESMLQYRLPVMLRSATKKRRRNLATLVENTAIGEYPEAKFWKAINRAAEQLSEQLAQQKSSEACAELLQLYWQLEGLRALDARYPELLRLSHIDRDQIVLSPIDVQQVLSDQWPKAHSVIGFSATLDPAYILDNTIALSDALQQTHYITAPALYRSEQLKIRIIPIDLRYKYRQKNLPQLADRLNHGFACGRNIIFVPSYAFLAQLSQALDPDQHWLEQPQNDHPEAANQWLQTLESEANITGLAVLGSRFSEGIELKAKLERVAIVTLGLPPPDGWRDAKAKAISEQGRNGHAELSIAPAMRQAIQAAGRLLRSPEDHGELWLVDQRWPSYRNWLPKWWAI